MTTCPFFTFNTPVFSVSVLLLMIKLRHSIVKVVVDPRAKAKAQKQDTNIKTGVKLFFIV